MYSASSEEKRVTPASAGDARRFIEKTVADRLDAFNGTIDPLTGKYRDDPYAQIKSLSEHIAADYHGRCLIELIQNGNDAHPSDRGDGEIEVLLANEGPYGTVYVANRGLPFSEEHAGALLRIGQSSKPPGEAIGNKGLGFRSVSHLCDAPEIYSQSIPALVRPSFEGFCFSLEHGSALNGYFDDSRIGQLAERDLPMYSIPRWLTEQPERVRAFAERGFASVVRLELRDEEARTDALGQFQALMSQSAPTLVFMERLSRLTALVEDAEALSPNRMDLTRTESRLRSSPLTVSVVNLAEQGTFLLTRGTVPESAMKVAIAAGVAAKQLHGSWGEWSGDGEVALAVRMDNDLMAPRLYTFLPMSDGAAAPFHGYLHGSFFPTSSRKAIDSTVKLNALLLDEAASLAAATVRWLAGSIVTERKGEAIGAGATARAVVDLLAWGKVSSLDGDYAEDAVDQEDGRIDLPAAVARRVVDSGGEFSDAAIVPCLSVTKGSTSSAESITWRSPRSARSWSDQSETFTVRCVADHGPGVGIAPIWPCLGERRTNRLVEFLKGQARREFLEFPTLDERAEIAELLAKSLPRGRKMPVRLWRAFYRDLVQFMDESPGSLTGRQIILCGDGMLRSGRSVETGREETSLRRRRRRRRKGEKVEASLFFPPAPQEDNVDDDEVNDGLKVPSPLKNYFAFASEALPWHGELKRAREFLEGTLVSPYDGRTVLTRLSQVVNNDATITEAVAGLRWAFAIWRRAGGRLLGGSRNYRLLVPTVDGAMIPATDAVFSESWPDETRGKRLKRFLDVAPLGVADLVEFGQRRLAPTSHRAFRNTHTARWVEFLTALGVNRGLFAVEKQAKGLFKAHELTSFTFCDDADVGIPKVAAKKWKTDVERSVHKGTSLEYSTEYTFKGSLWWLPGQADHESFSNHCRVLYAALVVEWLDHAPEAAFSVDIKHHYYSDKRRWPTPVAAFLRGDRWMPADDPQTSGGVRGHFAPPDVWISGTSGERFPYYLRQPAVEFAKAIERVGEVGRQHLVAHAGLRVLGERSTLFEQASFMANQYHGGTVTRHYEPQFINLYSSTWRAIADWYASDSPTFAEAEVPEFLVARRGSELLVVAPGQADALPICVRDNDDEVACGLISAAGHAILEVKGADPTRIGVLFHALYGDHVRLVSQLRYDVRADNLPIEELPYDPTALDVCAWLRPMAAIAIEALTGTTAGQLPADRSSLLARLGNVGLRFAAEVVFELNGIIIPFTSERRAHLLRRVDATPIVVAAHVGPVDWAIVEDCLPAICNAIELPQIATNMRLLARELAKADVAVEAKTIERSDLDLLGRALYLDEHALSGVQHLLGNQLEANLPWVRAVVHLVGGSQALESFDRGIVGAVGDPDVLRAVLAPLLVSVDVSSEAVIDACLRSFTAEDFRERLEFTLASFNGSLVATGSEPETYPALHAEQVRHFVTDHEVEMIQALRNKVAVKLRRREAAPEYVRLRDEIRLIAPDPAWQLVYKTVPDEVIATYVQAWLAKVGAPPMGENPSGLPPVHAVRRVNSATVAKFATEAAPLVRTWCDQRNRETLEVWTDQDVPDAKLRTVLQANGIMDFRELDHADLLSWCVALGLWPQGMEETLDRDRLSIETTDIEAANARARKEAEKREARARSVQFNGRDEDPKTANWTNISDVIAAKLSPTIKGMALGTLAALGPVTKRRGGTGPSPPRSQDSGTGKVPQAKKDMIGRLGELIVYHWLKARFQHQDIDAAWVSKNGDAQLGRTQGSDDLGFDFRVEYRRQTWQIEVKASVGDQQRFVMGETEVRAAREAARPRSSTRYVVVYVANPHNPANTHIDVLPNPMGPEAEGVLDLLGEGVRFGFKRSRGRLS